MLDYDKRVVGTIEDDVGRISRAVTRALSFQIGLSLPFCSCQHNRFIHCFIPNMTAVMLISH